MPRVSLKAARIRLAEETVAQLKRKLHAQVTSRDLEGRQYATQALLQAAEQDLAALTRPKVKLEPPMLFDHRGIRLMEGQTVAYNWQGEVAVGKIVRIASTLLRGHWSTRIKVVQTHPHDEGKYSTVTGEKNLLVLFENV